MTKHYKLNWLFISIFILLQTTLSASAVKYDDIEGAEGIYYPSNISMEYPTPVVFFLRGGFSSTYSTAYNNLLRFVANEGYTIVFVPTSLDNGKVMEFMNKEAAYLDTSRIGIIGHSVGGGKVFNLLLETVNKGWGNNGRFIFSIEPWLTYKVSEEDIRNLPSNTNFVIQQYGPNGLNDANDVSGKIPLTQYYLLDSIDNKYKDYQIIEDANINHSYPYKTVTQMPKLVKPLAALMKYTFTGSKNEDLRKKALELGTDNPYDYQEYGDNKRLKAEGDYNTIDHTIVRWNKLIQTLESTIPFTGIVDKDTYKHYRIDAKKGDTVRINLYDMDNNGDLYVKMGNLASKQVWDCKSENTNKSEDSCTVILNQDDTINIAVYPTYCISNVQHTLKVNINENNTVTTLQNNISTIGLVNKDNYKYYKINGSKGDSIKIRLYDMDNNGDLYVKIGQKASHNTWDCKSENTNKSEETCSITLNQDDTIYIAVYPTYCIYNVEHKIITTKYKTPPSNNSFAFLIPIISYILY